MIFRGVANTNILKISPTLISFQPFYWAYLSVERFIYPVISSSKWFLQFDGSIPILPWWHFKLHPLYWSSFCLEDFFVKECFRKMQFFCNARAQKFAEIARAEIAFFYCFGVILKYWSSQNRTHKKMGLWDKWPTQNWPVENRKIQRLKSQKFEN